MTGAVESGAGGAVMATSALSSAPRAARRLSVGKGMQAELPEDLALEDLEVRVHEAVEKCGIEVRF